MLPRTITGLAAACVLSAGITACDDPAGSDISRISILLTDAPDEQVVAAQVAISRIELLGGGPEVGGSIVLRDAPWSGDVMELQNTFATLVADMEIPSGVYREVRIVFTGMCIEVDEDGDMAADATFSTDGYSECTEHAKIGDLQPPSFFSSGLKVKLEDPLEVDGGTHTLLLDYDVAQSYGHPAGSEKWVAHPVVRGAEAHLAATVTVNVALEAAVIAGGGDADAIFAAMTTTVGGETMPVIQDGAGALTGTAAFGLMLPGDYSVDIAATGLILAGLADVQVDGVSAGTGLALPAIVTVGESGDAIVDITVSSVTPE